MNWLRKWVKKHYWRQDVIIHEVTARCNLRCAHCYNIWKSPLAAASAPKEPEPPKTTGFHFWKRKTPEGPGDATIEKSRFLEIPELSTRRTCRLIDRACRDSRRTTYTLTGGEPCLIDTSPYKNVGFGFCSAGTSNSYYTVDPIGNVRPCNHSPLVLGTLFTGRMADMARSETMRRFMAARPAFCEPCRLADQCQGGCKAAAEQCYGDAGAPEPFLAANLADARPL